MDIEERRHHAFGPLNFQIEIYIKMDPTYPTVYYNRGVILERLENQKIKKSFNKAIESYDKVIELNPKDTDAYINKSDI